MAICVGCGLDVNENGILVVQRRPGGGIGCADADGIFVEPGVISVTTQDSDTFNFDTGSNGLPGSPIKGDVIISTADYNGMNPSGALFARCPSSLVYTDDFGYAGASFPVNLNANGAEYNIINFGGPFTIQNNLPWTVEGFWDFRVYGGLVRAQPGFDGFAFLRRALDGVWQSASPPTNFRMDNRASAAGHPNGGVVDFEPATMIERNYIAFGPNQSFSFELGITIHVNVGAGAASAQWLDAANGGGNPFFEFYLHCTQTGNCP